jgi:hypothetical protein
VERQAKRNSHTNVARPSRLTAHAQMLNNSQRGSNDARVLRVEGTLDGNDELRNHGTSLLTGSI